MIINRQFGIKRVYKRVDDYYYGNTLDWDSAERISYVVWDRFGKAIKRRLEHFNDQDRYNQDNYQDWSDPPKEYSFTLEELKQIT